MRKEAERLLGEEFDLKEFHEFLLEYGPAPFSLIKKELNRALKSKT